MACGGDVRTIASGVVVGGMMLLVACTHTRTHARTHARTHTYTRARMHAHNKIGMAWALFLMSLDTLSKTALPLTLYDALGKPGDELEM